MPPDFDLSQGNLFYMENGTMKPLGPIREIVSLREENDVLSVKSYRCGKKTMTEIPSPPYRFKLIPGEEFTATIKITHYFPWKWNMILGWRRHTVFRPRKRVLVKLIKQGHTLKGKKVLV